MSLVKASENARFNAGLGVFAQYHYEKGIAVIGANGKPVVYVQETDAVKGVELMKSICEQVFNAKLDHHLIELNEHAFVRADYIGAITIAPEKAVVINNAEGEVIYWLEETDSDKAELICSEICKAYDTAGDKKPHIIDWPTLMA